MRRNRIWVVVAATCALLVGGPVLWLASADTRVPDPQLPNVNQVVSSDQATGGIVPSLPVPAKLPTSTPRLSTDLDPRGTRAVPDGPVTVTLKPNGGSVTGTLVIDGRDVRGTASGLNPNRRYITLSYGNQSTAQPGQLLTCADARTAANPRAWVVSGEWQVDADGTGTLRGQLTRGLEDGVYTLSIRQVPATAGADPLVGFTPVQYPVRACGAAK